MKPKKIVFLILLILSPAFVWAQNLDGTIKIAVTNSGDRLILPIVLTTNNYKEETHDSSTLFFMQLIYIQVQKNTFDWIENYWQHSINEVDS